MSTPVNHFKFANDELTVSIPASAGIALKAVSLDIGPVNMQPATGFKPIRVVANIAVEEEGKPGIYLTQLPQPLQITVRYRASDFQAARGKPLALAFWDGSAWVRLTSEKHGFQLTPDADAQKGGVATLTITQWGDPAIGWGT